MIEIVDCKQLNKGSLLATINIKLPKMRNFVINNITVWEKNGKRWVSMPSREYESEGKKKFFAHCRFEDREINDQFQNAILDAFECYSAKLNIVSGDKEEGIPF